MTSNRIRETALAHFAKNGYEGASLADISAEVGIKKQSIYNYFKGKDELFLTVFRDAADREMQFTESYLQRSSTTPLKDMLYGFCIATVNVTSRRMIPGSFCGWPFSACPSARRGRGI